MEIEIVPKARKRNGSNSSVASRSSTKSNSSKWSNSSRRSRDSTKSKGSIRSHQSRHSRNSYATRPLLNSSAVSSSASFDAGYGKNKISPHTMKGIIESVTNNPDDTDVSYSSIQSILKNAILDRNHLRKHGKSYVSVSSKNSTRTSRSNASRKSQASEKSTASTASNSNYSSINGNSTGSISSYVETKSSSTKSILKKKQEDRILKATRFTIGDSTEPSKYKEEDDSSIVDQSEIVTTNYRKKSVSIRGSSKRNGDENARLNRISACGTIETIVYKAKDGKEKVFKGKLHHCPEGSERVLLELASMSEDEGNLNSKLEVREDIECGVGGIECREGPVVNSHKTTEERIPILAEDCNATGPLFASLGSQCSPLEFLGGNIFKTEDEKVSRSHKQADFYVNPMKKVRFSSNESSCERSEMGSTRSFTSKNGILKKTGGGPWQPVRNTPDDPNDSSDTDEKDGVGDGVGDSSASIANLCIAGITLSFAIIILGLVGLLVFFFIRIYNTSEATEGQIEDLGQELAGGT